MSSFGVTISFFLFCLYPEVSTFYIRVYCTQVSVNTMLHFIYMYETHKGLCSRNLRLKIEMKQLKNLV